MKANPGGQIAIDAVIGRDAIIEILWDTLEQQSLIKTAERRIGKTTIAKKMTAEPRSGWEPVLQDLEQYHSALDFAMSVYHVVHRFLTKRGKATRLVKELLQKAGGTEVAGLFKLPDKSTAHWKDVLTSTIGDLMQQRNEDDDRLVFLWDEIPYMLGNIRDREGPEAALEVLDVLRALRQEHPDLRMVFTGSIGLHHVLRTLQKAATATVNDMLQIEIQPLEHAHAVELANHLVEGEQLPCDQQREVADVIAGQADCFPFYIHHIVKALKIAGGAVGASRVRDAVAQQLVDENDPWELYHYRERLKDYYGDDETAVLEMLDMLAEQDEPLDPKQLLAALNNVSDRHERESLLARLKWLVQDHYLTRNAEGQYAFRFSLVKRWWKLNRAL